MNQQSKAAALLRYLGLSLAWLVVMVVWPLLIGPQTDPHCYTSATVGFLPAAMAVPFLILPLYVVSAAVHAVFALSRRRFEARARGEAPHFTIDALFFVPFTALAIAALAPGLHWSKSLHCFMAAFALALPWLVTPLFNARLARAA